jgi:benzodiazapine receptor
LGYCVISVILLVLGGWLTYVGLGDWYYDLNFPPFQPPNWLFTWAWVVVLSCLAVSTWMVTCKIKEDVNSIPIAAGLFAMILYGAQCVLNAGWSLLFFTLQRPDIALWELALMDLVLLGMVWSYARISFISALLLVPYVAWLALSTAINIWIVIHNDFPVLH